MAKLLNYEELPEVNSKRWLSLQDLQGEIWRPVVGYEKDFVVSNYSRIKSLPRSTRKSERIIKPYINPRGYYEINIFKGKRIHKKVHRIVMDAFCLNSDNKEMIDHIDTNKLNNHLSNLRWVTAKENSNNPLTLSRVKAGLLKAHKAQERAVAQLSLNGDVLRTFRSIKEAHEATGVNKCSIGAVARGRSTIDNRGWKANSLTAGGYKWKFI